MPIITNKVDKAWILTKNKENVIVNHLWECQESQSSGLPRCKKTCEVFLCFVAIVRVRVYYVDFFVFFVLRHWWVLQVLTQRMGPKFATKTPPLLAPCLSSYSPSRYTTARVLLGLFWPWWTRLTTTFYPPIILLYGNATFSLYLSLQNWPRSRKPET